MSTVNEKFKMTLKDNKKKSPISLSIGIIILNYRTKHITDFISDFLILKIYKARQLFLLDNYTELLIPLVSSLCIVVVMELLIFVPKIRFVLYF